MGAQSPPIPRGPGCSVRWRPTPGGWPMPSGCGGRVYRCWSTSGRRSAGPVRRWKGRGPGRCDCCARRYGTIRRLRGLLRESRGSDRATGLVAGWSGKGWRSATRGAGGAARGALDGAGGGACRPAPVRAGRGTGSSGGAAARGRGAAGPDAAAASVLRREPRRFGIGADGALGRALAQDASGLGESLTRSIEDGLRLPNPGWTLSR